MPAAVCSHPLPTAYIATLWREASKQYEHGAASALSLEAHTAAYLAAAAEPGRQNGCRTLLQLLQLIFERLSHTRHALQW